MKTLLMLIFIIGLLSCRNQFPTKVFVQYEDTIKINKGFVLIIDTVSGNRKYQSIRHGKIVGKEFIIRPDGDIGVQKYRFGRPIDKYVVYRFSENRVIIYKNVQKGKPYIKYISN